MWKHNANIKDVKWDDKDGCYLVTYENWRDESIIKIGLQSHQVDRLIELYGKVRAARPTD